MLTLVLVDLIGTLVVDDHAAPAAADALAALAELDTADGHPLRVALLTGAIDPRPALDAAGLHRFFPADAQRVDGLAGLGTDPADGLVITARAEQVEQARALGMPVVQIGVDVPGWAAVPAAVTALVDPANTEATMFAESLRTHGQLAGPGVDAPAATHHVDPDATIRRDRFRAV